MREFKKYFHHLNPINYRLLACFIIFFGWHNSNVHAQLKPFTIVLDAGHGGHDPGNLGTKRYDKSEKDIALDVTLKVGAILNDEAKDIKVLYTRTTDIYPDLWQRAKIANESNADFFISIHCNFFKNNASGTETFVLGLNRNSTNLQIAKRENDVILLEKDHEKHYQYDPNAPESIIGLTLMQEEYLDKSIELAQSVENSFVEQAGRFSRGVKQAGLIVLHQTYMPSVLIEIGFLSNREEEDFLNSESGQLKIANSIADAIKRYKLHTTQNEVDVYTVNPPVKDEIKSDNIINPKKGNNTVKKDDVEIKVSIKKEAVNTKNENEQINFKVQLAAGTNKLETTPSNFKGLKNVERIKVGAIYKYYIGNSNDYNEIETLRLMAKDKGYKSAFIVAFKNNEQIDIELILKSKS